MITRHQVGIILVIIGTALLAFSVRVKRQYEGEIGKVVDEIKKKDPDKIEPTETYIKRSLFWFGLLFIAVGSLLQW